MEFGAQTLSCDGAGLLGSPGCHYFSGIWAEWVSETKIQLVSGLVPKRQSECSWDAWVSIDDTRKGKKTACQLFNLLFIHLTNVY